MPVNALRLGPYSALNGFSGLTTRLTVFKRTAMLAWLIALQLCAACGGGGSAGSGSGSSSPPNPVPNIVSLNPSSATAGGTGFALTITGENFIDSSSIQWNGSPHTTTFSSSTQLQAQISAADIANPGSATVSVINSAPGGGNSGFARFDINATSNPTPSLGSLSPPSVSAGSSTFILTVSGTNFIAASTISWNGFILATTYLSDTQLEAEIDSSNVLLSGFAAITVMNPAPSGGESSPIFFSITSTPRVVTQAANDLVWDSSHQLIYVSVPSLAASHGNTVTALDPSTGITQLSQFAGSEPRVLAISDDNRYLYAGLDGAASVQRFTLPDLQPDIRYSLGADSFFGPYFPVDVQVAPGIAHTTAVSRGISNSFTYGFGGMAIYDDSTVRPTIAHPPGSFYDSMQWRSDSSISALNSEVTNFDLYTLTVSSSGIVQSKDYKNEISHFFLTIHYDPGTKLLYTEDGDVIDPTTGRHVGAFQAGGLVIPDSSINRAFFLGQTVFQLGTPNFTIEAFDLRTFVPLAEIVVPNVGGLPTRFIRWGTSGLAFNDSAGYVYILENPFVTARSAALSKTRGYLVPVQKTRSFSQQKLSSSAAEGVATNPIAKPRLRSFSSEAANPVPAVSALNPSTVVAGVDGFTLTVTGSNFLSFSNVEWNGKQLPTEYVSSSELLAQVSAADVATGGTVSVNVLSPGPGGGASNTVPFTVISRSNPVPSIETLNPDSVAAGSPGFTLTLFGSNFGSSSLVAWNGSTRSSVLTSSGQLDVQINATDIATPGYATVIVSNPGPGGAVSNAAKFQILYRPMIVNQATNDLVWDRLNNVMYISVPGSASTHANQVCVLTPATAKIVACQNAGNEPDVLAISDDSHFLYVGEDGTGSVQRFILPGLQPDISFSLGSDPFDGPYFALDLQVAPGAPHTIAVSKGILNLSPSSIGGITVFDDATPRAQSVAGWGPTDHSFDSLQWGSDATELYAANSETTAFDFYRLDVSSSGVVLNQDYPRVFWNPPTRLHFDRGTGFVYSDGFHAIDPSTGLPSGIYDVGGGWPMAPDSAINTMFILTKYVWQSNADYTIDLFDMDHFIPVAQIPFSTVQDGLHRIGRFIRWGTNGLALSDQGANIYFISGSFVSAHRDFQ